MSMRAYQRSRLRIVANSRIASRYDLPTATLIAGALLAANPRSRPATAKLATRRLTSHSNGPGSVSSKSLTPKTSRRSGAAKAPKFERCASPQSWACSPVRGVAREVGCHQRGRAAVERERRDEHAPVADRHEFGHAGLRLLLEQDDRIRPVRRRLPLAVRRVADLGPRGLAARGALVRGEVLDLRSRRSFAAVDSVAVSVSLVLIALLHAQKSLVPLS